MLAIWVPELPFQLACLRDSSLRRRPLAFLKGGPSPYLWLINRQGRAEGLQSGDPLDQALRQVSGLRVLDPHPHAWWEAQHAWAHFLEGWSPQGRMGRMGEALLELGGTTRIHGPPQDAARRLQGELESRLGFRNHGGLSLSATVAQIASRLEQGLECIQPNYEASFLAPMPLDRLSALDPRLQGRFRRLGLYLIRDLQGVPAKVLAAFMDEREALSLLQKARGEDRIRLPMFADPPGESRHLWRLSPPCLSHEVSLAAWLLTLLWKEPRSPRRLWLTWWDVDGKSHRWSAGQQDLSEAPLELARITERAFRANSLRRMLVYRLELRLAWGLGLQPRLFLEERSRRFHALDHTLTQLRKRFPAHSVRPGWMLAAEGCPSAGALGVNPERPFLCEKSGHTIRA